MYTVSQNICAKLFLSELRQLFANFDNFLYKDGKEAKLCKVHSFSISSHSRHHTTVLRCNYY